MGIAFSVLSLLVSLVGAALPAQEIRQRIIQAMYGFLIVIMAYVVALSQQDTQAENRIENIEKAAAKMVQEHNQEYTKLGFVHASLVFLEKNKDLYPDTYNRAVKMCIQYQCDSPSANAIEMSNLSLAMAGLLTGLTTVNDMQKPNIEK